jgi:protein-tyrosine phosphatase
MTVDQKDAVLDRCSAHSSSHHERRRMKTQLYTVPIAGGGSVSIMARPRGGDWIEDEMTAARASGVDVVVSALTEDEVRELELEGEEQAAQAAGVSFRSMPIPDRGVPSMEMGVATLLSQLAAAVHEGRHVAVHCRMGIGRSSMIAAILLALQGEDVDAVFQRLQAIRGSPIPDTEEQRSWTRHAVAALADRANS